MFETFNDVIALWPTVRAMSEETGVHIEAIPVWKRVNHIPDKYWLLLLSTPTAIDAGLTGYQLMELAADRCGIPKRAPLPRFGREF